MPIHKDEEKENIKNYRPITKLSYISKILDAIIRNKLIHLISTKISVHQHGFIAGRSTLTNLLVYEQGILEAFIRGGQVDVPYMDFSKACDTVDYNSLFEKLDT